MKRSVPVVAAIVANVVWIAVWAWRIGDLANFWIEELLGPLMFLAVAVVNVLVLWSDPRRPALLLFVGVLNVAGLSTAAYMGHVWVFERSGFLLGNPERALIGLGGITSLLTLFALWFERRRSR